VRVNPFDPTGSDLGGVLRDGQEILGHARIRGAAAGHRPAPFPDAVQGEENRSRDGTDLCPCVSRPEGSCSGSRRTPDAARLAAVEDWLGLQYAIEDADDLDAVRGGSTITQQVAKNLWLSPSRNPLRKVKEAILTWQLERKLGKLRILELYLNVVEFGPGVWGAEAAARHYFGRPAADLDEDEAARLAASLPSPSTWHPGASSPAYRRYVDTVRRRMDKADFLRRQTG
jgi:hypothetical protein